jgi:hypothetical protein
VFTLSPFHILRGIVSDSLAIDIKLKAKYELCAAAVVLCCVAFCSAVTFTTAV